MYNLGFMYDNGRGVTQDYAEALKWYRLAAEQGLADAQTWLGLMYGRAVRFGGSASGAILLAGEGIETVLSVVTAVPGIHAAAALSAGSLGTFEPPQDLALLVIARDKDVEGWHAANRLQHRCMGRLKEIHDAGIHRSAERWCPHHAAHRGSLNVPALPAGSRVERNALTPLRGTRSSPDLDSERLLPQNLDTAVRIDLTDSE